MDAPNEIEKHEKDYKAEAWQAYTLQELGNWVHLLAMRATMRETPEKRAKDFYDAENYLRMMNAKLQSLKNGI